MIDAVTRNRRAVTLTLQSVCLFLFAILHYSNLVPLKIFNANPIPAIPFIVVVMLYSGIWRGVVMALLYGMFMDTVAADTICFNTLALPLLVLVCGLLITYYFNRNISATLVLGAISAFGYFVLKWLFLFLIPGVPGQSFYLFSFALPSALYTTAFIIPFYYIGKFLEKRGEAKRP